MIKVQNLFVIIKNSEREYLIKIGLLAVLSLKMIFQMNNDQAKNTFILWSFLVFSRKTGVSYPYDKYISCTWFLGYMWINITWA
jgi:hypothetical protein